MRYIVVISDGLSVCPLEPVNPQQMDFVDVIKGTDFRQKIIVII